MTVPTLLRVRETWLIKKENSRLPASEMQFPGSILARSRNVFFARYYLGRQIKISELHKHLSSELAYEYKLVVGCQR